MPSAERATLLLISGILNDETLWAHQVAHLSDIADCRVVDTTSDDSLEGMIRRALDGAPARFAVAGLSMGGYAVFEFLRQVPDRVTAIALLGTSAHPPSAARNAEWAAAIALTEQGRFEDALALEAPLMVSPERFADPGWRERVLAMGRRVGPDAYRRQHRTCVTRPDSRPLLARIRQPALVVCGRQDLATPLPVLEELAGAIPGARLAVIEDCGHLAPMEQPEAVTALFQDWLAQDG